MDKELVLGECNANNIKELVAYLKKEDNSFPIQLSKKVNIEKYVEKFINNGICYVYRINNEIIGLIAYYANDFINYNAFLTLICVSLEYRHMKIGYNLFNTMVNDCIDKKMKSIELQTDKNNFNAQAFYEKIGFIKTNEKNGIINYKLYL